MKSQLLNNITKMLNHTNTGAIILLIGIIASNLFTGYFMYKHGYEKGWIEAKAKTDKQWNEDVKNSFKHTSQKLEQALQYLKESKKK